MNDILFGWLLGMATIGGPIIYFRFREMKNQISFLRGNGEHSGPQTDESMEPHG